MRDLFKATVAYVNATKGTEMTVRELMNEYEISLKAKAPTEMLDMVINHIVSKTVDKGNLEEGDKGISDWLITIAEKLNLDFRTARCCICGKITYFYLTASESEKIRKYYKGEIYLQDISKRIPMWMMESFSKTSAMPICPECSGIEDSEDEEEEVREMTYSDFYEIAVYANENWNRGNFTAKEVAEGAYEYLIEYQKFVDFGRTTETMDSLIANLEEDYANDPTETVREWIKNLGGHVR